MQDAAARGVAFTVANLVFLVLHLLSSPYATATFNTLESLTLFLLTVLAATLNGRNLPYPTSLQIAVFCLLGVPALLICLRIAGSKLTNKCRQKADPDRARNINSEAADSA